MGKGYENIYITLLPRLAACDFPENARRLGLEASQEGVRVSFLNREYLITAQGVEPTDGRPVDVNNRSVLIYYILSEGAGELSYDFAPLGRLTGLIEGQNNLGGDIMSTPLVREFGADYNNFAYAMKTLGGVEQTTGDSKKHVWDLQVLPKILSRIVYYEADDEFPVDIQILFDKTAPRFLDFECLAFLSGCMLHALIDTARQKEK